MRIIIPVIVGAIIGYCTNWLAIKMLFRPHYERKFLGIRIPFTPGLIPKERKRIAKSIGEAVGIHLLSPETIIEALGNDKTEVEIKQWLGSKIALLKGKNESIKDFIISFSENKYYGLMDTIEKNILSMIISKIREEKFKIGVYNIIEEKVTNIDSENAYILLNGRLREIINELSTSVEVKNHMEELLKRKLQELALEERKLSEILPEEFINSIYNTIDKNERKIGAAIRENFKDPAAQEKIGFFLTELILQHVPKLVLTFVGPDTISQKILQIIEKYVDNEETDKYIIMFVKTSLGKLLDSKVNDIIPKEDSIHIDIEKIVDGIIKAIFTEENKDLILNRVDKELRNLEGPAKKNLLIYINENINIFLESKELENTLLDFTDSIIADFMNKPFNSLVIKIDDNQLNSIYEASKTLFHRFAKEELPQIIQLFNISKIVEDKINSFDVDFTEELILDIAHKELKAITWLGALLGGIMGILTPLLQLLY